MQNDSKLTARGKDSITRKARAACSLSASSRILARYKHSGYLLAVITTLMTPATLNMCAASFVEQAKEIRVPTLVLAGSYDPLLTPDMLKSTVLTQIAGARMVALPCGHEIPQEMPEQTAALVEAFLSGVGQVAGIEVAAA